METKPLDCLEVCAILEACKDFGVQTLKFNGLEVVLGGGRSYDPVPSTHWQEVPPIQNADALADQVEKEAIKEEALYTKEEQLALMAIEDPVEYERLILSGELENDKLGEKSVDESL